MAVTGPRNLDADLNLMIYNDTITFQRNGFDGKGVESFLTFGD